MYTRTIQQILPANHWWVLFKNDAGQEQLEPVVCFALVNQISEENGASQSVIPMVSTLEKGIHFADEIAGYQGVTRYQDA